ncbi:hypothetical protein AWJ20_415 [Sugiyamaella lignohabitans]|uniref:Uncharacterized protein n=1 Tax=Sugiyamaella lignohabitans TaxID=796027 RepID=A0A161HIB1_9ASCO|nr:uncharacterized protein AWJ20_415 [Sugiyamaella lignohabitans]ANB12177.1 hypothetical protein AWJ20_415 [Sugiyamaella lignohabitans]
MAQVGSIAGSSPRQEINSASTNSSPSSTSGVIAPTPVSFNLTPASDAFPAGRYLSSTRASVDSDSDYQAVVNATNRDGNRDRDNNPASATPSRPVSRSSTFSGLSTTATKDGVEGKRVHRIHDPLGYATWLFPSSTTATPTTTTTAPPPNDKRINRLSIGSGTGSLSSIMGINSSRGSGANNQFHSSHFRHSASGGRSDETGDGDDEAEDGTSTSDGADYDTENVSRVVSSRYENNSNDDDDDYDDDNRSIGDLDMERRSNRGSDDGGIDIDDDENSLANDINIDNGDINVDDDDDGDDDNIAGSIERRARQNNYIARSSGGPHYGRDSISISETDSRHNHSNTDFYNDQSNEGDDEADDENNDPADYDEPDHPPNIPSAPPVTLNEKIRLLRTGSVSGVAHPHHNHHHHHPHPHLSHEQPHPDSVDLSSQEPPPDQDPTNTDNETLPLVPPPVPEALPTDQIQPKDFYLGQPPYKHGSSSTGPL